MILEDLAHCLSAGRLEEAVGLVARVSDELGETPDFLYLHGLLCLRLGRADEAARLLEQVLTLQPGQAAACHALAQACRQAGRPEDAAAHYHLTLALDPDNDAAAVDYAHLMGDLGWASEAVPLLKSLARRAPDRAALHYAHASAALDAGDPQAAQRAAEEVCRLAPDVPDGWSLLGTAAVQARSHERAAEALTRGLALAPGDWGMWHNRGLALTGLNRLDEAEADLRQALALAPPATATVWASLGACLMKGRKLAQAAEAFQQGARLAPADPMVRNNLALVLSDLNRVDEALEAIGQAAALAPARLDIRCNRANILRQAGRMEEAETLLRQALAEDPDLVLGLNNLATVLLRIGRTAEALPLVERALELASEQVMIHSNRAQVLQALGRVDEAVAGLLPQLERPDATADAWALLGNLRLDQRDGAAAAQAYDQALALDPDCGPALVGLGGLRREALDFVAAEALYRRAVELTPDDAVGHNNLGIVLMELGRVPESLDSFDRALAVPRPLAMHASNRLFCRNYDDRVTAVQLAAEHRAWDARFGCPDPDPARPHRNRRDPAKRLHVAYLSGDFRVHSVANFIQPVLLRHDRSQVRVTLLSMVREPDGVTEALRTQADGWVEVGGLDDDRLCALIEELEVDILVELSGHTAFNRLSAVARKPAPVQVSWLGYPGSLGLSAMDWRFSDPVTDPPEADALGFERIWRLEKGFLTFWPLMSDLPVAEPPFRRKGHITFGSFNTIPKLSPTILSLWAELLRAVPDSRLYLKTKALGQEGTAEDFRRRMQAAGLDLDRVDLGGHKSLVKDHLSAYGEVDIGLDTHPYNGTTTSCEALWMGVPIVSLLGGTHVSRVGAAILTHLGLSSLVAETPADYVRIAARLADDREALARLRAGLRPMMQATDLCDSAAFTARLEQAYRAMWQQWCTGPQTFQRRPRS